MAARDDTAALLERDSELEQIARLVDEACGGAGRLLLVEGPAGVGKTRLLGEIRHHSRARGMSVLTARASELDREFPFGVVRQLFEPLLAASEPPRRARLVGGPARLALAVVGGQAPAAGGTATVGDPSLAHLHGLSWMIANLADETPVVVVVDDAHWSDVSSLRFLRFLLPRVEELPVLLALAVRPSEPDADQRAIDALATDALARVLRLAPLSEGAVTAMIESELQEGADRVFCQACYHATGGNPFLVRELLRELSAEGSAPTLASVPLVRELTPPTVARAVLLRLARLGDDACALARAVAVLGDGAPLAQACSLAGLPHENGAELAGALAQAEIFTWDRPPTFAHPMLRSAIYRDIRPPELARRHRRAAALLAEEGAEPDAIALHLLATDPARDGEVVAALREAARRAVARGAAANAVVWLRRALREPPTAAKRGAVLLELASAELRAGEPATAADHFDEGMRLTSDPRVRAARAGEHAVTMQALGRDDEAFALRERALAEVAEVDPGLGLSLEATLVGTARWDLSRLEWARAQLARYRDLVPESPAEWRQVAMRAHLDAFSANRDDSARSLAEVAEPALASLVLSDLSRGYVSTGFLAAFEVLLLADRVEPARRGADQAVDAVRRSGSASGLAFALGWRSLLLARDGALVAAETDARQCLELSLSQGWFSVAPMILGFALGVLVDRGHLDDAHRLLEASGMADRAADHRLTLDPVVHARARIRAARGDVEGGRSDLASLRRRGARWNTYPTLAPAALTVPQLMTDDPGQVRADAERTIDEAHGWGTARAIGMALRAAGLVEAGTRRLELLGDAARILESSPAHLEHARALTDFGAALRRANRRTAAREPLRQALDIADACGARPLAARARQELRAAGGRPRNPRISGRHALTVSEKRIAAMAAEGLSNPEIARTLFVTRKTVEAHLSNAYRKLDIRSRRELGRALGRDSS